MDTEIAWQMFAQTGRVQDYLRYCQIKAGCDTCTQEGFDADQHRRTGNCGENCRGK